VIDGHRGGQRTNTIQESRPQINEKLAKSQTIIYRRVAEITVYKCDVLINSFPRAVPHGQTRKVNCPAMKLHFGEEQINGKIK